MNEYIKKSEAVDVIVKYPYNIAGKTATAIKMIEDLPSADVVPKSELEISQHLLKEAWKRIEELDNLVQDGTRLGQENETLKDNNEHLAVMLEEAKSEVDRLKYNLKAVLEEIPETKREFVSEIFEEIERIILDNTYPDFNREHKPVNIWKAKTGYDALDELKKKYTEGVKKE